LIFHVIRGKIKKVEKEGIGIMKKKSQEVQNCEDWMKEEELKVPKKEEEKKRQGGFEFDESMFADKLNKNVVPAKKELTDRERCQLIIDGAKDGCVQPGEWQKEEEGEEMRKMKVEIEELRKKLKEKEIPVKELVKVGKLRVDMTSITIALPTVWVKRLYRVAANLSIEEGGNVSYLDVIRRGLKEQYELKGKLK